jgi:hypothetical protein
LVLVALLGEREPTVDSINSLHTFTKQAEEGQAHVQHIPVEKIYLKTI